MINFNFPFPTNDESDTIFSYQEKCKYREEYIKLVEDSLTNPPSPDQMTEKHHIIPKCMGGSNDKTNFVVFSVRNHIIAHYLLCRIFPENKDLRYAINITLSSKKNKINLEDEFSIDEIISIREQWISFTRTKEFSELKRTQNSGKKRTPEQCKNISESKKGSKNPMFGKTLSKKHIEALVNSVKGEKNVNYGKVFSEDEKRHLARACGGKQVIGPDGTIYPSVKWAARESGIPETTLTSKLKKNKDNWRYL